MTLNLRAIFHWLHHPNLLFLLFIINALGTIYGYIWYADQLVHTWVYQPRWLLLIVPDSPTASLWFTIAIFFLWLRVRRYRQTQRLQPASRAERWIGAFAVASSIKYGIWAVVMIVAADVKGVPIDAIDLMLIVSHLGMALEAAIYMRSFQYGLWPVCAVAAWLLLNDVLDYKMEVFPWLHSVLHPHLTTIQWFTIALTVVSVFIAALAIRNENHK